MDEARTDKLVFLPRPYPDETLHGVVSRYAAYMGPVNSQALTRTLFGTVTPPAVDLPTGLRRFARTVHGGSLFSGEQCVRDLTLLPFVSFGATPIARARLREKLLDDADGRSTLPIAAGLAGSRVPRPRHLRHCPLCARAQRANHGEAYWRRVHQLPGVLACADHACLLVDTAVPYRRSGHRRYHDAEVFVRRDGVASAAGDAATLVARFCAEILAGRIAESDERLSFVREALRSHGAPAAMSRAFCEIFPASVLVPMGCALDPSDPANWFLSLLRRPQGPQHAVRHALVRAFLGQVDMPAVAPSRRPRARTHRPTRTSDLDVAALRGAWERALDAAPSRSRASAARSCRPVYDRLALVDREWLFKEPRRSNPRPDNQRRVDLARRDLVLAPRLEDAVREVRSALPVRRLTRSAILRTAKLPMGLLGQLPGLPQCRVVIEDGLESLDDYHVRLVARAAAELRERSMPVSAASLRSATKLTGPIGERVKLAIWTCQEVRTVPDGR